jgi:hypothetical protein
LGKYLSIAPKVYIGAIGTSKDVMKPYALLSVVMLLLSFQVLRGQITWNDLDNIIINDVTVREDLPDSNFENEQYTETIEDGVTTRTFWKLYVRDTIGASSEIFLKLDLSSMPSHPATFGLRMCGSQNSQNIEDFNLEVYGSLDADWQSEGITWNNSRSMQLTEEPLARVNFRIHSWNGKYVVFEDHGLRQFLVDAEDNMHQVVTLVILSGQGITKNFVSFYSLEQQNALWYNGSGFMWDDLPHPLIRSAQNALRPVADAKVFQTNPDENYGYANSLVTHTRTVRSAQATRSR